jgi:hypothetical protein
VQQGCSVLTLPISWRSFAVAQMIHMHASAATWRGTAALHEASWNTRIICRACVHIIDTPSVTLTNMLQAHMVRFCSIGSAVCSHLTGGTSAAAPQCAPASRRLMLRR